ncbi:hypothetical protein BB559_001323 [Furculomyces boomerangus]|uniref:Uncharacterized protein n=1 Tax=Furculomyces boomerangus TaxID=61424 RepID=A0A2T9Z2A0_9FUNG|nr:hypothetical protein BB559_001323 [Furculomyces boomerangus]
MESLFDYSDSENSDSQETEAIQKVEKVQQIVNQPSIEKANEENPKSESEIQKEPRTKKNSEQEKIRQYIISKSNNISKENEQLLNDPEGECDKALNEKFKHWLDLKKQGYHFNEQLQRNKNFRNPNIYTKFLEHLDIKETGTNFPKDIFDPDRFPDNIYYDKLNEQRTINEQKRVQEKQQFGKRSNIDFITENKHSSSDNIKRDSSSQVSQSEAIAKAAAIASSLSRKSTCKSFLLYK